MKNFMHHNQIVHHKPPYFKLFILHNNLFDNQGNKINKNDIFCSFPHTVYIYMQSWKQCALPVITTMALWYLMHLVTWCTVYVYYWYMYTFIYIHTCIHTYMYISITSPLFKNSSQSSKFYSKKSQIILLYKVC